MISDSDIIIYAIQNRDPAYLEFATKHSLGVSAVSVVEVLGYHQLDSVAKLELEHFFNTVQIYPVDELVIEKAVQLRQQRKMSLGDALIAATALVNNLPLVTNNTADFIGIPHLQLIDPLAP